MRKRRNGKRKKVLIDAYERGYRVGMDGTIYNPNEQPLTPFISSNYPAITVYYNGEKHNLHVHRLQAYQKFGEEMFKRGMVVRHENNDKTDPSHKNIILGTDYENHHDNPPEVKNRMYSNLKNYTPEELDGSEMPF